MSMTTATPAFSWKDFSRFVEVSRVQQGWLVIWGRYHDLGNRREHLGNRIYADRRGARRRVAEAALELTRDPALANDAVLLFDRAPALQEGAHPQR